MLITYRLSDTVGSIPTSATFAVMPIGLRQRSHKAPLVGSIPTTATLYALLV